MRKRLIEKRHMIVSTYVVNYGGESPDVLQIVLWEMNCCMPHCARIIIAFGDVGLVVMPSTLSGRMSRKMSK